MSDKLAEKKEEQKTIRELVESDSFKLQVAKALPKHLTPDRFIQVACTAIMRTPKLLECDQTSFFNALLSLSQLGLEPDGRLAHLIPFMNRKRNVMEVQLIIDYKGLVELVMRSGTVANIHADVVCENDVFVYNMGKIIQHTIDFRNSRGNVYAAYATIHFKDGTEKTEVMSYDEIKGIQKRSKAGDNGPWITDWNEMAKKCPFRRATKWVSLSPEYRDIIEKDFDSFEPLNQPSAKGMIPPPPLKKQPEQKFDETVTVTVEPEPEKQNQGDPAHDQEPPADFKLAGEEDDNSLDGLKSKIRKAAAQAFPNENSFALWLKTATTSEDGKYKGYDTLSFCKSIGSAKVIYGKLQKLVEDKKKKDA